VKLKVTTKHVEDPWFPYLDAGSNPAGSTENQFAEKTQKKKNKACFNFSERGFSNADKHLAN